MWWLAIRRTTLVKMGCHGVGMDGDTQRTIAVWTFVIVSFVLLVGFILTVDDLTLTVVGLFWVPVVVLTLLGVLPRPWHLVTGGAR